MTHWNEQKPAPTDLLAELPSALTTNAIAFREAIEKHSYWTDSGGIFAGTMRLSDGSFGPGSCRAFYAPVSSLSTALSTTKPLSGRLHVTSDTSRLYLYQSSIGTGGPVQIGAKNTIVYWGASATTIQSDVRVRVENGVQTMNASASTTPFAFTYAVPPTIQLHAESINTLTFGIPVLLASGTTNFTARVPAVYGGPSFNVYWRSFGTVAL